MPSCVVVYSGSGVYALHQLAAATPVDGWSPNPLDVPPFCLSPFIIVVQFFFLNSNLFYLNKIENSDWLKCAAGIYGDEPCCSSRINISTTNIRSQREKNADETSSSSPSGIAGLLFIASRFCWRSHSKSVIVTRDHLIISRGMYVCVISLFFCYYLSCVCVCWFYRFLRGLRKKGTLSSVCVCVSFCQKIDKKTNFFFR